MSRRGKVFLIALTMLCGVTVATAQEAKKGETKMYGLIGKMIAVEGKRDELIAILLQGTMEMPGCLNYIVAKDPANSNAIWITEVWTDEISHKASLSLPEVRNAIAKGKPLIAKFEQSVVIEPVGGYGIGKQKNPNR